MIKQPSEEIPWIQNTQSGIFLGNITCCTYYLNPNNILFLK